MQGKGSWTYPSPNAHGCEKRGFFGSAAGLMSREMIRVSGTGTYDRAITKTDTADIMCASSDHTSLGPRVLSAKA